MCTHILILIYSFPIIHPILSKAKTRTYKHVDQLPPFNLSLLFTNELGFASYQRILGVDFVDDGVVNSIQDMFTERTLVFLAEDFTELMPLTLSSRTLHCNCLVPCSYTRCLSPWETNFSLARLPPSSSPSIVVIRCRCPLPPSAVVRGRVGCWRMVLASGWSPACGDRLHSSVWTGWWVYGRGIGTGGDQWVAGDGIQVGG